MRQGFKQTRGACVSLRVTRRFALIAAVALLAGLVPRAAFAQQINASITGTVTTAREEVIPGASVVVESKELAVRRAATTDDEGFFVVPNLPVGIYRVTVEAEGFTAVVQESVKLDVGNTFSMTVRMNVAGVAETVQVSEKTYQIVNTETANVETLISGTQVTELALNGRNWAQLINLAPGTSSLTSDTQQGTNVRIDDTAVNGLRRRTAPTLDGASNVDHGSVGTQVNNISVDAIQEFKLVSSPYSAEYGAQAGPAVNVVTKRGTTEYHGSIFEFFRHDALNAYSWESKQRTAPEKALLRFNNFGGFVGGPAYKEKLFFFGGVEFKRPRTGRSLNELVPTEAMRRGDFSAFLPAGVPTNNTSCTPAGVTQTATRFILCDKSASTMGVAFPGNVIPASKMSPNGLAILKLFPLPNAGADRYIAAPVTVRNVRQDVLRVDYQATQNSTLFVRWLHDRFDSDNPLGSTFDNQNLPIAPDNHVRNGKTLLVSQTQVLSPTLVNEASAAWQRNDQEVIYQDEARIARSTYGINFAELFAENRLDKIPQVSIQGYSQISGNGLPYAIDARNWELRNNLTKVWGGHTWKFGAQYINAFKSENTRVRDGGDITFSTGSTAGTSFRPQDAGHAVANLLLGAFTRYTETSNTTNAPTHYNQFETYANDQWRAHKRLTLTLGLRSQYIPWAVADDGNVVGFDPARFDPAKAPLASNISGGVINLTADPTGTKTRAQGFFDPYNGLVHYLDAQAHAAGEDLYDRAGFREMHKYVAHSMLPSGQYVFDFGDIFEGPLTRAGRGEEYPRTHPGERFHTNYNLLYRLASRFGSGEAQGVAEWLGGFGQVNAEEFWSLVWYDPKVAPVPVERQERWHHFEDHGVVYWRSGWGRDATAFAFKCGPPEGHATLARLREFPDWHLSSGHAHPDANSFIIYAGGRYLTGDSGYAGVPLTAHHNSLLVDGRGQAKEGEGHDAFDGVPYEQLNRIRVVEARMSAGSAVVVGDAAAAYDPALGLTRFERRFEFDGRGFNVTDDVQSSTPRTFTALVHADEVLKREGAGRFSIDASGARLDILVEAPADARAVVEENVLTAPGPPGSVGKGERQVRGRRLAVSTPGPQTRARFRLRLSAGGS